MSSPVQTVSPETTVADASKIMAKKNIGSLIIVKNDMQPVGIITERDIIVRVLSQGKEYTTLRVGEVMTKDVKTVPVDATLLDISKAMNKFHVRRIVILEDGKAVGIVTSRDIIELVSL